MHVYIQVTVTELTVIVFCYTCACYLTVARSPLTTGNDDQRLKTHSKDLWVVVVVVFCCCFFFLGNTIRASGNRSGQVKVLSPHARMAT